MRVTRGLLAAAFAAFAMTTLAADDWREARAGYTFEFPRDHASHPDYKIEWWYYTGNLDAADGRRFGYQVTFFRVGIVQQPASASRWAVRDLFMTHVAISDVSREAFHFAERMNRAGPGLAGASTTEYRVWNDDWIGYLDARGRHVLKAATPELAVDLLLEEGGPPVIHGKDGISQKGARDGNASHYYSLTRMPTTGHIRVGGERVAVTGASWMDHEFGTSFLEPEQQGWDWMSLQLDDGGELMIYQLRRGDGTRDPRSSGTFVAADGRVTRLVVGDFDLSPGRARFEPPNSTAAYPLEWRVEVPKLQIDLNVRAAFEDQELRTLDASGVRYWEGAVDVAGTARGRGYLEMTGYGGQVMGRVLSGK